MIDTHCHILPGVDDGAPDMATALAMAAIAVEDGIRILAATPHIDSPMLTPSVIRQQVEALNRRLADANIPLTVVPGGEVASFLPLRVMETHSINGRGYILLEFPHSHLPVHAAETIRQIEKDGFRVLIAHPERNPGVIRNPGALADLVNGTGALVQITGGSLTGEFGTRIRSCARTLLKKKLVHVIASDAHSAGFRRPVLSEALTAAEKMLGPEAAGKLVRDNPRAVILGEPVAR
ncbi:tyrosine protein phosphatase [Desulfatiferula olefinivorans]